jgi:hypothetical protein
LAAPADSPAPQYSENFRPQQLRALVCTVHFNDLILMTVFSVAGECFSTSTSYDRQVSVAVGYLYIVAFFLFQMTFSFSGSEQSDDWRE